MTNTRNRVLIIIFSSFMLSTLAATASAEIARYKSKYKTQQSSQYHHPIVMQNNYSTIIINNNGRIYNDEWRNTHQLKYVYTQHSTSPWYSPHNAFKVASHPEKPVLKTISSSNRLKSLRRGQYLSDDIYQQGVIIYRAPRGVAILRVGSTSIKFYEDSRKIISVINP